MGPQSLKDQGFPHRENRDGSYDSICPMCAFTVATCANEFKLAGYERRHVCDPARLRQLKEPLRGVLKRGLDESR